MDLTFASLLTPAGIVAAGALVTGFVQLLKGVFPAVDARVSGALLAFATSALLYAAAAVATSPQSADGYLTVFAAWLACATASVGIKSATAHVQRVTAA